MQAVVFLVLTSVAVAAASASRSLFNVQNDDLKEWPECQLDVANVLEGLGRGDSWALMMVDASTKLPNGILTGNLQDYGSYDECLSLGGADNPSPMQAHHCMASIAIQVNSPKGNTTLPLMWSYCIPRSCPPAALQEMLASYLPSLIPFTAVVSVSEGDCNPQENTPLSAAAIVGIVICLLFVAMAVISTACDVLAKTPNPWFSAFSLYTNGKKLLNVSSAGGDNLAPLHGVRFLSICWVILGHRYFFMYTNSIMNYTDFLKDMEGVHFQLIAGAVLAVDTFFLLSGLLNAYNLLRVLEDTGSFPAVKYYVHRYLRTTPALAIMVLVYASWFMLLGDGPAWNRTAGPWRDLCVDYWWPTLLYINNYYNPVTQCAGQSWYLAVDMQLYWLSPLVMLPIWKWPKSRNYYFGFLLLASTVAQFVVAYVEKIRMPFTISPDLEEYKRITEIIYVPTHMRTTPYIIGLYLGCHLHEYRLRGFVTTYFSKKLATLLWLVSAALCLAALLGNHPFYLSEEKHPYNQLESSFYISLYRIAWSVGVGYVIVACLFGRGGFVNTFLSWGPLVPFSRLTYCIFLVHMGIQQYQIGTIRNAGYYQDFNQVHRFLGDLVLAVMAAALLSLLFESPVLVLEKLVLGKARQRKRSAPGAENPAFTKDEQ